MQQFQSYYGAALDPEKEYTRLISERIAANNPNGKIWTARGNQPEVNNAAPAIVFNTSHKSTFFRQHSEIDISWSPIPQQNPSTLLEIKRRSSAAVSQDVYTFLAEVCALAAEVSALNNQAQVQAFCTLISGLGERTRTDWLRFLLPQNFLPQGNRDQVAGGDLIIVIDPNQCVNQANGNPPNQPYWLRQMRGNVSVIQPDFRAAINKIFTGTTKAHLSGIFSRQGRLEIQVYASEIILPNDYWLLQYEITGVTLIPQQPGGIPNWWP
jgi:hypothetical protein